MNIKYHQGGGDRLRRHRSAKTGINRRNRRFFAICGIAVLCIALVYALNQRIKPVSLRLAESYGSSAVLDVINGTVSDFFKDRDIGYSDLVRLGYNSEGAVTSVEYNSAEMTRMKIDCLSELNKNLGKLRSAKIRVPVGSLFDDVSLSARGPAIYLRISESAVPDIEILSSFESVGINQSRHEIALRVSARVSVYLPPKMSEFTVTQDYVLAQTVIVGDVPSGCAFVD